MMEALELRMFDESLQRTSSGILNFAVKAEKKAGKGKTKPVYKRDSGSSFDFDKELKKMKNRRKPSRFAGITKLLDREGGRGWQESYSVKAILSAQDKNFSSVMKSCQGYANNLKTTLTGGLGFRKWLQSVERRCRW